MEAACYQSNILSFTNNGVSMRQRVGCLPGMIYGSFELCHQRQQSCRPLPSSSCACCTVCCAQMLTTARPRQERSKIRHAARDKGTQAGLIHPAAVKGLQNAFDLAASPPQAACRARTSLTTWTRGLTPNNNSAGLPLCPHLAKSHLTLAMPTLGRGWAAEQSCGSRQQAACPRRLGARQACLQERRGGPPAAQQRSSQPWQIPRPIARA